MHYAIISHDMDESLALRAEAREEHLARLERLREEGRLLLAGPFPAIDSETPADAGYNGSLVVAEFDCLEDAQAWAESDPYVTAGVYRDVEVQPFKALLP